MTTQPETLRLAETLDLLWLDGQTPRKAAAELRRLHAVNQELLVALCCVRDMVGHPDNLAFIDAAIAKAEEQA